MRRLHFLIPWTLTGLLALPCPPARSQGAAPVSPTLAQALARAEPPADSLSLTVDAAKVRLPKQMPPPPAGAAIADVAEDYERITKDFGAVTAIAPPQMTVVYSPPVTPDPYTDMPPGQIMQMLTQSFSRTQWNAFMGASGLGYGDLDSPAQQRLFAALFPGGHLVIEQDNPGGANDPKTKQDITGGALMQAHLRLGYLISEGLQSARSANEYVFGEDFAPPGTPARYVMLNSQSYDVDREYGAPVRQTLANVPKRGQLDWDSPALKVSVPITGIRTVDELVTRSAAATHLELYADPRYAARAALFIGPETSARASDLLQALALCVTGTYRQVGPAYVLTDGLTGIGTKHALWKAFEAKGQSMLPNANVPFAVPTPNNPYTTKDISWGDDPMAFTAAQQKKIWAQFAKDPDQPTNVLDLTLPFSQLSPGQQEVAQQSQQSNQKYDGGNTTLKGTVMLQAEPLLEISLPSLDGPVIVAESYPNLLPTPRPTPAERKAPPQQTPVMGQTAPSAPAPPQTPPGPLRPLVTAFAQRAAWVAPRTPQEAAKDLAVMKTLGFNEAWLEVITSPQVSSHDLAVPLMQAAVQAGRKDGIVVFPDLHLLHWGAGAPADFTDLDIEGLSPSEAAQQPPGPFESPGADPVTPFAPGVAQRLIPLVGDTGAVVGIGGMVWEDMTPPGYEPFTPDHPTENQDDPLGYALAGRLAFLRWAHADPVDIYTNEYSDVRAHVVVPGFNDDFTQEQSLYDRWRGLRAHTLLTLDQRLVAALPPTFGAGPMRLPLIVPPANSSFSQMYGSWDDLRMPPPSEQFIVPIGPDGRPVMGVADTVLMPSLLSYHVLGVYAPPPPSGSASEWADAAADALAQAQHQGWRNVVLDVRNQAGLLEALAARGKAPVKLSPQ